MHSFKRQMQKVLHVLVSRVAPDENARKWKKLKGKYQGQRAFLIGNGPSLNETPLYLLKNDKVLCFNRFYLLHERLNWYPDFYMCIDPEVLPGLVTDINSNLDNYEYTILHSLHAQGVQKKENVYYVHPIIRTPYFSKKPPLIGSGGTVAYGGLQILYYLGFKEVYLVGVDQNYVLHNTAKTTKGIKIQSQADDDPNHFDPRYFGKGHKYHQPVQATKDKMTKAFTRAREVAESLGVKIRNAGIGGMLEVYDRVDYNTLFKYTDEEIGKLFCETIGPDISLDKVNAFLNDHEVEETLDENTQKEYFIGTREQAKKYIPKLIVNYLPFGPYKDKYIFVRRDKFEQLKSSLAY